MTLRSNPSLVAYNLNALSSAVHYEHLLDSLEFASVSPGGGGSRAWVRGARP